MKSFKEFRKTLKENENNTPKDDVTKFPIKENKNFGVVIKKHDSPENEITHTAYLTHRQDKEAKEPVAALNLEEYQSLNSDHKILRPELRSYGHGDDLFSEAVRQWTEDKYPLQDLAYRKGDTDNYTYNPKKTKEILESHGDDHPELAKHIHANGSGDVATDEREDPDGN